MKTPPRLAVPAGLAPHLAAACIYAHSHRERASWPARRSQGKLADLAGRGRMR